MKNIFARILCAVLVVTTAAFSLTSCGKKYDTIYIEDDNGEIAEGFNENMVSYHMSMEKTATLASIGYQEDIPELWTYKLSDFLGDAVIDSVSDMTFGEYNDKIALDSAKKMVVASYLFDTMKDEETVEGKYLSASYAKMDAWVDNVVSELQYTIGSKADFESLLSSVGITMEDFRKYYEMNYKTTELRGAVYVSEEEKMDYFEDNYAIVKHILINTETKTNEAGEKVSLTAEEKEAKLAEVRTIEARLSAGEEYETVYEELAVSDPGTQVYTEGYFVTNDNKFMPEFQDAALDMKEGETRTVYTSYGAHIMKKYPMDKTKYNLYADVKNNIDTVLLSAAYTKMLEPYIAKVKVNEEVLANYKMELISMLKPEQ